MKKLLLISIAIAMSFFSIAQEKTKQQEVGLVFNNLDNFGLSYKIGTNKSLWRLNALFINGRNSNNIIDSSEYTNSNIGFGVKFGKEYHKTLVENVELKFGADIAFSYYQSTSDRNDNSINDYDRNSKSTNYSPGINLIFGLNYVYKDKLIIGAEILPYLSYTTRKNTNNDYENDEKIKEDTYLSYGLSNQSVLLSLAYRF